jgi:hypothetical protein
LRKDFHFDNESLLAYKGMTYDNHKVTLKFDENSQNAWAVEAEYGRISQGSLWVIVEFNRNWTGNDTELLLKQGSYLSLNYQIIAKPT